MWNPDKDKKIEKMMISALIFVCFLLAAVIFIFFLLQRKHEEAISAATDTEGKTEILIEIGKARKDDDAEEDTCEDTESEGVYLIKGNDTGSNPYEKADHLAYTKDVRYTVEELSWLDSYGLCITRNEIYARHGRMFSDQNIQDYFNRQDWYVAQTSSSDFDESVLNSVEQYNVELIRSYELQQGY